MIGKEYLRPLEDLARQQTQIFPDACDYGIEATPQIAATIRQCLNGLKGLEGGKTERWSNGVSYTTRLGFEMEEGKVQGVKVEVGLHSLPRQKPFYSIDITRDSWAPDPKESMGLRK